MKTLILMRHAKSDWDDADLDDSQRPLNARGRRAAGTLGEWMEAHGHTPDRALVSSALRTQETWARVASQLSDNAETLVLDTLYLAPPDTMLDTIRRKGGQADLLLVLAHNPGIAALATQLLDSAVPEAEYRRYPTGATAILDFEIEDWREVAPGTGRLQDFVIPRRLETVT